MLFSSLTFLYFFLPTVVILYYILPLREWRNTILLIFSLLFYAWGEPRYIALLLGEAAVAYGCGLLIEKYRGDKKLRCVFTAVPIVTSVGGILFFKYFNFFVGTIEAAMGKSFGICEIALPIGISFYTFQILSYVIDIYRGEVRAQRNLFYFLLYVTFFPQLIAGPIVRYKTIESEIVGRRERCGDFTGGFARFAAGLAKKVLLANNVAIAADYIFASEGAGSLALWLAAICYTFQIYFDFSGYSDMAIGIGRMFGFHFEENFNYPYISCSITEFWRRWHISLSSWFRDYVYIPLGGNRVGRARHIVNILIVWALTGFWHGASRNFILWGLYYGVLLLIEKYALKNVLKRLPKAAGWIYTAFFVMVGWVIFYYTDEAELGKTLAGMFVYKPTDWTALLSGNTAAVKSIICLPIAMLAACPVAKKRKFLSTARGEAVMLGASFALVCLCIVFITGSSYNPFIYFRF